MKFGLSLPNFNAFGDVHLLISLAKDAEAAGWEAFFLWDHMIFDDIARPVVDPWVALAAIATNTRSIRIGTMLTPLPRRRPWKVARETITLDHLSGGRLTLGVGLGDPVKWEYGFFHEETDPKIRAKMLDEGLEILTGLWSGQPFGFRGQHYQLEPMTFLPLPLQTPRIPIWVGGGWPNKAPFRRAARFDGVFPLGTNGPMTPENWRELLEFIHTYRDRPGPFDAAHGGSTLGLEPHAAAQIIAQYSQAGVNWWIEDISPYGLGLEWDQPWPEEMVERLKIRIRQGPPRVELRG
jgi:alkanesulfonate monooxygenase SsuD/methylene tetrahydromethanopterin reductase-like flavin-dependent oxidoreductase (luciferase family)